MRGVRGMAFLKGRQYENERDRERERVYVCVRVHVRVSPDALPPLLAMGDIEQPTPINGTDNYVGDLEDLGQVAAGQDRSVRPAVVVPRRRRRREGSSSADTQPLTNITETLEPDEGYGTTNAPARGIVHVKTWGCGHNNSDGEYMKGLLDEFGYTVADNEDEADLWVLNSCAVKAPSEDTFNNAVASAEKAGKKVVLAGCVPQGAPKGRVTSGHSIVGVQQIDRVVEVVEETLKGGVVRLLQTRRRGKEKTGGPRLDLPKIRRNPLVEVVPISTGCLNQCTYCKTKHARGELGSYMPEDIVERVRSVLDEGVVEIWITSEDTGAYGRDIGTSLPELLSQILAVMPHHTRLRLGMTNPPYILEHLDAIAKLLQHPCMYCYLHVPVQAGSDEILFAMKREYTQADFCRVVDSVQAVNPEVTIATDIIAGFPGETEADFDETMELCRRYEFPCLYINQFFPRPGTPAASMERVDPQLVKQRTKKLSELFRSYLPHQGKEGRRYLVLCAEESTDKKWYVAHNKSYDQILVPKRPELMGRTFEVEITEVGKFHMMGRVIEGTLGPEPQRLQAPMASGSKRGRRSGSSKDVKNSSPHPNPNRTEEPHDFDTPARTSLLSMAPWRKWISLHPLYFVAVVVLVVDLLVVVLYRHSLSLLTSHS
eukprot:m.107693 g.107693  ORF g.107693 m.107693 type:complete len:656 (-) comp10632_c2_seq2:77-2044(-)